MLVRQIETGGDRNFAYIVAEKLGGEAAIIDPSYDPERVLKEAKDLNLKIRYVLNTHDHHDHTNGNDFFLDEMGIIALSYGMSDLETGIKIEHAALLPLDDLDIEVIHTPGHTEDCLCFYYIDSVFTGDTLFVGKVGGTDFGEGARKQYDSLHNRLLTLPDETKVYPGHDVGVQPSSTIGNEKVTNPFLLQNNFENFLDLKKNWLAYKEKHGIA